MKVRSCYSHEVEILDCAWLDDDCSGTTLHRCTRCGALFLNPPDDSAELEAEERAMDFDHADAEAHCWDTSWGDE